MSPSQMPGGPFKGFEPHAGANASHRVNGGMSATAGGGHGASSGEAGKGLSIVGLVLSVLGIGCAPLGVAGVICGIIAMRIRRNDLALASIIVGSLTTLLSIAGTVIYLGASGLAGGSFGTPDQPPTYAEATDPTSPSFVRKPSTAEAIRFSEMQAGEIARLVYDFHAENGHWPSEASEVTAPFGKVTDGWGSEYMLTSAEGLAGSTNAGETIIFIWSLGPDKAWDTDDDFVASSMPYVDVKEYGYKSRP